MSRTNFSKCIRHARSNTAYNSFHILIGTYLTYPCLHSVMHYVLLPADVVHQGIPGGQTLMEMPSNNSSLAQDNCQDWTDKVKAIVIVGCPHQSIDIDHLSFLDWFLSHFLAPCWSRVPSSAPQLHGS